MQTDEVRRIPPYGPAKGMLQGLQLLQMRDPHRVDEGLLRSQQIAPNNEYKVIGALWFLGLIDELGRPTEKSRLLKTRGGAFVLNLQRIVREGYAELFRELNAKQATREDIYNYFVTHYGLGSEMATKATRFFTQICRFAEIDLPNVIPSRRGYSPAGAPEKQRSPRRPKEKRGQVNGVAPALINTPFQLLITPEIAAYDEEELTALFEKISKALRRAGLTLAPNGTEA
ncbi:MAG TPA: DUF5343 domain-containing protein [Dehalococcoidia bacterium]|nr:DUF5343 domain-containing protein [Dehalococcoidia bacterium]